MADDESEPATRPFDHLDTEQLLSVLVKLGMAPPTGDSPHAPLPYVDDMVRAMAGATLAGLGERLWFDHQHQRREVISDELERVKDASGEWRQPDDRLRAAINRFESLRCDLDGIAAPVDAERPLPVLLNAAGQMAQVAEHLVTAALAEFYGEHPARDAATAEAFTQARGVEQTVRNQGLAGETGN